MVSIIQIGCHPERKETVVEQTSVELDVVQVQSILIPITSSLAGYYLLVLVIIYNVLRLTTNVLIKVQSVILIQYTFCQIQQISSQRSVCVCAGKKSCIHM